MEDTLRGMLRHNKLQDMIVLILVLMEDTLRVSDQPDAEFTKLTS